jgi:hypothetical protein
MSQSIGVNQTYSHKKLKRISDAYIDNGDNIDHGDNLDDEKSNFIRKSSTKWTIDRNYSVYEPIAGT